MIHHNALSSSDTSSSCVELSSCCSLQQACKQGVITTVALSIASNLNQLAEVGELKQCCACSQGGAVIKMYTQIGSLLFAVVLGAKRAVELRPHATIASGFLTNTMVTLVAGAMLLRFVCDQNEDYGLGDGISLLICAGMAAGAPPLFYIYIPQSARTLGHGST